MSMQVKAPPIQPDKLALYYPPADPAGLKRGPTGAPIREFSPPISIWVGELPGFTAMSESSVGGAHRAQFVSRFLTRYRPDFLPNGRLEISGRKYEITGITPAPATYRNTWLHLHCIAAK